MKLMIQERVQQITKNRHKLKILGDWTVRYILDNKDELLLGKKYSCYDIGVIALEKFYEFAGVPIPEWLTRWITDTSLDELDVDEESVIRSILFDNTHKTMTSNDFSTAEEILERRNAVGLSVL